jgi:hypothetical protein
MGDTLTRRIGPLPVWMWAALMVVVLVIFIKYRQKKQAAAAQAQQQNSGNNTQGLQAESANAAADNLATESWPMPTDYGDGQVSVPTAPNAPPYPGSPMRPYWNGADNLNPASAPAPSPATNVTAS